MQDQIFRMECVWPLYTFQHSSQILTQCLAQSWPKVSIMVKVWVAKLGVGADESI